MCRAEVRLRERKRVLLRKGRRLPRLGLKRRMGAGSKQGEVRRWQAVGVSKSPLRRADELLLQIVSLASSSLSSHSIVHSTRLHTYNTN